MKSLSQDNKQAFDNQLTGTAARESAKAAAKPNTTKRKHVPVTRMQSDSPAPPSLEEVADKFSLNEKQRYAFLVIGDTFLQEVAGCSVPEKRRKTVAQMLMYVGGSGGVRSRPTVVACCTVTVSLLCAVAMLANRATHILNMIPQVGKSRVIDAVVHLFECHGKRHWLRICAYTAFAAGQVGGTTMHALMKESLHKRQRDEAYNPSETSLRGLPLPTKSPPFAHRLHEFLGDIMHSHVPALIDQGCRRFGLRPASASWKNVP